MTPPNPGDGRGSSGRGGNSQRAERMRVPAPLLHHRIPSGRGAMEQPNATGDGDAALTVRFWAAVAITGVATGLLGDGLTWVLSTAQHLAFGSGAGGFEGAVERASDLRRTVALLSGGAIAAVAWYALRALTPGEPSEVDDSLWRGQARLSLRRCLGSSIISEVVIGLGASLGREAAPKLMGGASASTVADRLGLTTAQRRLLVACGAGAGLAAVYDVPVGGALFAAEILIGTVALPVVLPALACSGVAVVVAWLYLPDHPTYLDLPAYRSGAQLLVWALLFGPLAGVVAVGYVRLVAWVSHRQVRGRWALVAPLVAMAALAACAVRYPQLLGNGQDMAHDAFLGAGALGTLVVLAALKPLVTSFCLGAGMSGGLLTPVLSTGAVLGAFAGLAWSHLWAGAPTGAYALVGAAALLGAGLQAPLAGLVLVVELTGGELVLLPPMLVATVLATLVARSLDGYSIYSGRLASTADPGGSQPTPSHA